VIPHPVWFSAVSLAAIAASAWIAVRVASGADAQLPVED